MTEQNIEDLLVAIRDISHGGRSGPMGFEALVMALVGPWPEGTVVDSLGRVAEAIEGAGNSIEAGLRALAEAVENSKE